jgi:hypothetical protein
MKRHPIFVLIGLAAAATAHAQADDPHARAAALLSLGSRIERTVPPVTLPSVAGTGAVDGQRRAAELLNRPSPSETASARPVTQSRPATGATLDAHSLARQLLDRRV